MGFFPHSVKKRENQWRVSEGFPFQYFVSCGVFISWAVTNKAHLIEISIYFLKVLVRRKKEKKKRVTFFTGNFTHSHPLQRCSDPTAWNEISLNVFDILSVASVLRDFISASAREGSG